MSKLSTTKDFLASKSNLGKLMYFGQLCPECSHRILEKCISYNTSIYDKSTDTTIHTLEYKWEMVEHSCIASLNERLKTLENRYE
jgi:hypothetical protein